MEIDALHPDAPRHLDADLCIVGAGPAGLALADALAVTGWRIVMLESGGDDAAASRELNVAVQVGDPVADLRDSRARSVGGTSAIWNTVRDGVAGAKYVELDAIDFLARDELPNSGWPVAHRDIEPWYAAAARWLELPVADDPEHRDDLAALPFRGDGLTTGSYRWGDAAWFREQLPGRMRERDTIRLVCHATVTRLEGDQHGVVRTARWRTLAGTEGTVRATRFVLACGAIENARLLLASRLRPEGDWPWLGGGLMEHPIDRSLTLVSRDRALSPVPGRYAAVGDGPRAGLIGRIGCAEAFLRTQRLWNASLRLYPVRERRHRRILKQVTSRLGHRPVTAYRVLLDLEQAPDPRNRVHLEAARDAVGMPVARVEWRWREHDEANRRRILSAIVAEFARTPSTRATVDIDGTLDPNSHHHAGTARMHADTRGGVVNADLCLHGFANTFVTGAAVFPTAGVANPTLTTIALTLRLADHLHREG